MKKIWVTLALMLSFLSALNVQQASKDELMCIKGIGEKKATTIIKYRKTHKLKSADDLLEIKGFGKVLVKNVQNDIKSVACGGKKSTKKTTKKSTKKKSSEKKSSQKSSKKDSVQKSTKKDSAKKESAKKESTIKKDTTK